MNSNELKERTKKFALKIIKLYEELSNSKKGQILGGRLLRSGTSVGANYRAACRAISNADLFIKYKLLKKRRMNLHIG